MTTRNTLLIETGRACFLAQIFAQYAAITANDGEVTDNDSATDIWAELDASAEAALVKRGLLQEPSMAPSVAITQLPVATDWLCSA